jgi:hypothetical protein
MLWPLTIACIDESGNRLPGAAIQVRDTLNPSVSVPVYDIDGQLVASPVAGPTGMAKVFLRNGYIDHRYTLDPYVGEWITELAIAPPGRAGRWRDEVGGAIAAGDVTDFTITVPNLGVEDTNPTLTVAADFTHPSVEDLDVELVRTGVPVDFGGPTLSTHLVRAGNTEPGAFSDVVTFDQAASAPQTRALTSDIDDVETAVSVYSGAAWPTSSLYVRIEDEVLHVTAGGTTDSLTVTRGALGTTAVAHGANVEVTPLRVLVPAGTLAPDIASGEQTLNGLAGIPMAGTWILRCDDSGAAGGVLNNWTITAPPNLSFA